MRTLNFCQIIFITFLLSSCATVGLTVSKSYPAKEANCKVDIYFSENEVTKPYEVIALIDSKTGTTAFDDRSVAGAIKIAQPKACQCGADGMIVVQTTKNDMSYGSWGAGIAMIKCIKYK